MNEWQLSRYLIDAKKCIDSLLYIDVNIDKMRNLDLKEIIENKLRHFYINVCIIIDHSFEVKELKIKKKNDNIIKKIYYERDKNYAHKDANYNKDDILKLEILIKKLKEQLEYCFKECEKSLPSEITLDYVSFDRNLFRFVNQISSELEDNLNDILYKKEHPINGRILNVFDDTEYIKKIDNKSNYAVVLTNGLVLKEGLQNRQDFCIKANVLHGLNEWCKLNNNYNYAIEENEKLFIQFLTELKNSNNMEDK